MDKLDKKINDFEGRGVATSVEVVPYGEDPAWRTPEQKSFFATIERLASRPDINPDKIKQIMDMNERVLDRNAEQAFNAAMMRVQNKIDLVIAKEWNEQTKSHYANLKTVLIQAKPIYTAEGFSLMFYEGETSKENHKRICVDIMHEQGHTKQRYGDFAIQTTGIAGKAMMTQIHGEGSAISYGRRYLTCMIFNIPTGDDNDGNITGKQIKCVSSGQIKAMQKIIDDKKIDSELFFTYISEAIVNTEIKELEEIPESNFKEIMTALRKKQKETPQERGPGCDDS